MATIEMLRAALHPSRRRIIMHLHLHGPTQVGTLARDLEQQVGSISHHLRMLARAGIVEPAPELSTHGRASWWRLVIEQLSWSIDDFADTPADLMQARAAEKLNFEEHVNRWVGWKRRSGNSTAQWRRAAFSSDFATRATPEELHHLDEALQQAWHAWKAGIDETDGQEREPVFFFAHGFPSRP